MQHCSLGYGRCCPGPQAGLLPSSARPSIKCSPIPPRPFCPQVRSQALLFIKRMYEKEQLREYVEKFALNYLQLLVHPNPPSVLFGADKDTGLLQVPLVGLKPRLLATLLSGCWE